MKTRPLYSVLASLISAAARCDERKATEWATNHRAKMRDLVKEHLPSGSGFDSGTTLNEEQSTGEKLVFETAFHHMDDHGGYDGWTEHRVTVRPSLELGYRLTVSGPNREGIKDYIAETFGYALDNTI